MANTILLKRSSTTSNVPTAGELTAGELAINTTDERIWSKNTGGTVWEVTDHDNLTNYVANEHIDWTAAGGSNIGNAGTIYLDATIEDKISLYDNRLGSTTMYGFGVEASYLYGKSNGGYRWYSGANADGGTSDILELQSNGNLVGSGTLTGFTTYAGITDTNLVDKSAAETISNTWTFTTNPIISNALPYLYMRDTNATADEGNWIINAGNDTFNIQTASDAAPNSAVESAITINRAGTAVSNVTINNGNLVLNENLTFDAVTNTIAGIQNQNLLDKTAAESISNDWNWQDNVIQRAELQDFGVTHTAPTVSANAVTVDLTAGNSQLIDMDPATAAVTLTLSNPPASGTYGEVNLIIVMGTPAYGMTWPGSIVWQNGGTAPTLSTTNNEVDLVHLFTVDGGTTWYGTYALAAGATGGATTLAALTDTDITTPADASLLLYDTGTATWRDAAMSGDATITDTGVITVSNASTADSVAAANVATGSLASGVNSYFSVNSTNAAFKVPFLGTTGTTAGNYGMSHDTTATFTYNPSSNTLSVGTFSGSGASLTSIPETAITDGSVLSRNAGNETISGTWTFSATKSTHNTIFMNERASATTDVTGDGQLWVKSNAPNDLYYTTDNGLDYPVAYARYRVTADTTLDGANVSETLGVQHINGVWYSDNATAYTLTLQASTVTTFPVGAQMTIWNEGSGTLTINEGTSTTLYLLTGSAVTDTAGGCTMGQGGYATLIRKSTTVYLIMGAGLTA